MIASIEGKLVERTETSVIVNVGGIHYDVAVTRNVLKALDSKKTGDPVNLVTFHYHQTDPSKSIPVLIGFMNRLEREFFEKFITVSGIGPKGALRALSVPIPQIAHAIDGADIPFLKTLPGVGEQRAREIVAKLQGKVARFGLIPDGGAEPADVPRRADLNEEALSVLLQLQYKREEARQMIERALQKNKRIETVEELLNEVYRQRTVEPAAR